MRVRWIMGVCGCPLQVAAGAFFFGEGRPFVIRVGLLQRLEVPNCAGGLRLRFDPGRMLQFACPAQAGTPLPGLGKGHADAPVRRRSGGHGCRRQRNRRFWRRAKPVKGACDAQGIRPPPRRASEPGPPRRLRSERRRCCGRLSSFAPSFRGGEARIHASWRQNMPLRRSR